MYGLLEELSWWDMAWSELSESVKMAILPSGRCCTDHWSAILMAVSSAAKIEMSSVVR